MKLPTSPVGIALYAVAGLVAAALAYVVVYRMFFQGQDLAREQANRIVAEEQVKAEEQIVSTTLDAVKDREVYREHITTIVRESNQEITNAWNGETVGDDVDRAGSDALCRLHDNLCRFAPAEDLQ